MEKKTVIRKTKHSDFVYGYPYVAENIGSVLRIKDPKFTGDSHIIYSTDEFYVQDENHTYVSSDGHEEESVNKCITMRYLLNYNGYIIFRGLYFMSGDGSVDDDSECYYIYKLGSKIAGEIGRFTQYNEKGQHFATEEEGINYVKTIIDRSEQYEGNSGDCEEMLLEDLETFGTISVYIMNVSDMLKTVDSDSCVEEFGGLECELDYGLDEVMF